MKFADTGGWFALFVPEDVNHASALNWYVKQRQPLFTTKAFAFDHHFRQFGTITLVP